MNLPPSHALHLILLVPILFIATEIRADLNVVYSLHADYDTDADILAARALLRATSRDERVRDPQAAVADAREACRVNYWRRANYIEVLARACAAAGDHDSAARYQQQAI